MITSPKQAGGFPGDIYLLGTETQNTEPDAANPSPWTEEGLLLYTVHGNGEQQHSRELLFASFEGSLIIFPLYSFPLNNVFALEAEPPCST